MMKTPICDFVQKYVDDKHIRMHMPGHKGVSFLGYEAYDITEVVGADSLYEAQGIIKQSENIASKIFGCSTFYSTEGSSQCIRAMLYLLCIAGSDKTSRPLILAGRNAHKTFISAVSMLDIDVEWIFPTDEESYLSCNITPDRLSELLKDMKCKPDAVYITTPDYLGNLVDVKGLADVCHMHGILLLVDNAHGAYLKFLPESKHPIDLGADICCDSAHKTLPALTGAAYLHLSDNLPDIYSDSVKDAMAQFGSTSPSYLILQSLDYLNYYISEGYAEKLASFIEEVRIIKEKLVNHGFRLLDTDPLKITLDTKACGYIGYDYSGLLISRGVVCEYADPDNVVLMLSPDKSDDLHKLGEILLNLKFRRPIIDNKPTNFIPERAVSIREACFAQDVEIDITDAVGRTVSRSTVGCPPAVPIVVPGEIISEQAVRCFEYYGIEKCKVIK
jgi:arginine/lysine/ornithine decarboxylase